MLKNFAVVVVVVGVMNDGNTLQDCQQEGGVGSFRPGAAAIGVGPRLSGAGRSVRPRGGARVRSGDQVGIGGCMEKRIRSDGRRGTQKGMDGRLMDQRNWAELKRTRGKVVIKEISFVSGGHRPGSVLAAAGQTEGE